MPVNIEKVLISDPVDESCAALLAAHGVSVTVKYKLSKDELINELKVKLKPNRISYYYTNFNFILIHCMNISICFILTICKQF